MRVLAYLFLICFSLPSFGERVYRLPDERGVAVFSDRPGAGAEVVTLGATLTYPAALDATDDKTLSKRLADEAPASAEHTPYAINIKTDSLMRSNAGNLLLRVDIHPELQEEHRAELLKDGQSLRSLVGAGPVQLTNLNRGTHAFSVRVLDPRGKVLAQSADVPVTLLRHSRLRK